LLISTLPVKPSIIAVTEIKSKVKWEAQLSEFTLDGYEMYCNDLHNVNRGIIVYVDKKLNSTQISFSTSAQEYVALTLKSRGANVCFCTFYRSPSSSNENNIHINKLITEICDTYKCPKILVGDFNYNGIDWDALAVRTTGNNSNMDFLKTVQDNFLTQHVVLPTRARGVDKPSILDLILTDEEELIEDINYLSPLGKSDHSVLAFNCKLNKEVKNIVNKYNFNKGDYVSLSQFVSKDWAKLFMSCNDNIEEMWNIFKNTLITGTELYVPKIIDFNMWRKPSWKSVLPKTVRDKIRKKHRLWARYIKSRDLKQLARYKKISNEVRTATRKHYQSEQTNVAMQCKTNPKKFWSYIKNKTKTSSSIGNINCEENGTCKLITDDEIKAEVFNDYFSSVFTKEKADLMPDFSINSGIEPLHRLHFNDSEILDKLNKLNVNKTPGPDNIHPRILYETRYEITGALKLMYETSLRTKELPQDWVSANITAIFKKGQKSEVSNYRPVSLTSIVCKIMESIVRDYIMEHFIQNDLFSNKQFGFLPGRSTVLQLLNMLDEWTDYLELGGQVNVIYTDFTKAFDKVPHKRLLYKLEAYKIGAELLQWIQSFLIGRKQRVKLNGKFSIWTDVLSGIPQGSVLGPLLFIIFINDLPEVCDQYANIYLFADDAKIFRHIQTNKDHTLLQKSIIELEKWCDNWLLPINVNKCSTVFYGRDVNVAYDYHLHSVSLQHLTHVKDLGVTFNSNLTFTQHCAEKINKANSMLGLIKRNFIHVTTDAFLQLYKTLVRSHLEYANCIWNPYRQHLIKDLEKVQMRASRLIPNVKNLKYEERLRYLKLPTLKYRRIRGDMIQVYKLLYNKYDSNVSLHLDRSVGNRTRGNSLKLCTKRFHYDLRKNTFTVRVINIWNSLPDSVVLAKTLNTFKNKLDNFWQNQEVKYNYKASLTGIGNRSLL